MPGPFAQRVAGRSGRTSRFLLDWNAWDGLNDDGRLVARTGQVATLTRGGTVGAAIAVDARGSQRMVGSIEPRFQHQYDATRGLWTARGLMLEGANRRNLVLQSDALATGWTPGGTCTANNAVGIYAGRSFSRINNPNGGSLRRDITLTGDGTKGFAMLVKQDGSAAGWSYFLLYDATAGAFRGSLKYTVAANGVVSAVAASGSTSVFRSVPLADGVYRIEGAAGGCIAANANRFYANDTGGDATLASVLAAGCQAENATFPSSDIPTTTAEVTRTADDFTFPFDWALADFTVLVIVDVPFGCDATYDNFLNIGNTSNGAEIYMHQNGSVYPEIRGTPNAPGAASVVTPGSTATLCAQFRDWGSGPSCRLDAGGGFGAWSAASNARAALGAALIRLNGGSNGGAYAPYQALRLAAGLQTRTWMMAA